MGGSALEAREASHRAWHNCERGEGGGIEPVDHLGLPVVGILLARGDAQDGPATRMLSVWPLRAGPRVGPSLVTRVCQSLE